MTGSHIHTGNISGSEQHLKTISILTDNTVPSSYHREFHLKFKIFY